MPGGDARRCDQLAVFAFFAARFSFKVFPGFFAAGFFGDLSAMATPSSDREALGMCASGDDEPTRRGVRRPRRPGQDQGIWQDGCYPLRRGGDQVGVTTVRTADQAVVTEQRGGEVDRVSRAVRYVLSQPHRAFLLLAVTAGLFFVFYMPPFSEPDENAHLDRIYQIASGNPLGQLIPGGKGAYLPLSILRFERLGLDANDIPPEPLATDFREIFKPGPSIDDSRLSSRPVHFENTELYSPVVYAPQVVSMWVAMVLDFSVAKTFFLVRLAGLAMWLAMCAFGLKKMRTYGWIALIVILTPLSLQIASGVTADSMTVGATMVFLGLLIDKLLTRTVFTKAEMVAMLASVALLACVKMPYVGVILLLLILPEEVFPSFSRSSLLCSQRRAKWACLAVAGTLAAAIVAIWTAIAQHGNVPFLAVATNSDFSENAQVSYLLRHPINVLFRLVRAYSPAKHYPGTSAGWLVTDYVGCLGLNAYFIPNWATALYFAVLGGAGAALHKGAHKPDFLSTRARWGTGALVLGLFVLVNLMLFVTWTPLSDPVINGIQARYFIPIMAVLPLCFVPLHKKDRSMPRLFAGCILVGLAVIQLTAALALLGKYHYYT